MRGVGFWCFMGEETEMREDGGGHLGVVARIREWIATGTVRQAGEGARRGWEGTPGP